MMLGNLWGLIGFAAGPVILFIHLFRRRFPPKEIAGLFLWLAPRLETQSGERRQKLPISLPLILELLAACLLAFLLCDFRMVSRQELRHTVFVLDNSASMSAVDESGESVAGKARAFVKRRMAELPRISRGTVILTGERPLILGRTEGEPEEVMESLASYRPGLPGHSPVAAFNLAAEVAGDTGEIVFLSDHLPGEKERLRRATCIALGTAMPNLGFVSAEWSRASPGSRSAIFLRVGNYSARPARATITGRAEGRAIVQETVSLAPGAIEKVVLSPPNTDAVSFSLPPDGLDADNHVVLVAPPRRIVKVSDRMSDDVLRDRVEIALNAADDVSRAGNDVAHLAIAPAESYAPEGEETWCLVIGAFRGVYRGKGDARNFVGPFLVERAHPLVDGVPLQGILWPGAAPADGGLTPIVSVGDVPLVASLSSVRARTYWLNLDLARSNLTRSPDWPVLISNLIEIRRAALPGLSRRSFRAGEAIGFRSPDPSAALTLAGPEGFRKNLPALGEISLPRLTVPGIYRITAGGRTVDLFTLNLLDEEESDLRTLGTGEVRGEMPSQAARMAAGQRPPWLVFLAAVAILGAVLWNGWLNRRRTDGS